MELSLVRHEHKKFGLEETVKFHTKENASWMICIHNNYWQKFQLLKFSVPVFEEYNSNLCPNLAYHIYPIRLSLLRNRAFLQVGKTLLEACLLGTIEECRIIHIVMLVHLGTWTTQRKIKSAWSPTDTRITMGWPHLYWKNNSISSHGD